MTPQPLQEAAHASSREISALGSLAAALGPANLGDAVAILLAGLHIGSAIDNTVAVTGVASPRAAGIGRDGCREAAPIRA